MVFGLMVNYWKSCLVGVNGSPLFLQMACTFLNCMEGAVPFKYLDLPVDAYSRILTTWEPMLEQLRWRLGAWGYKRISFGGRIVLFNSVLNVISIFYMSFLKMSVHVWKKVMRIQREFL